MPTRPKPDATAYLDEPRAGRLNIQYAPESTDKLVENPPRFTWLPVVEEDARYVLRVSQDAAFPEQSTRLFTDIRVNFLTPDVVFEAGRYFWSYALWDAAAEKRASDWSKTRSFDLAPGLPEVPLPTRPHRFASASKAHPRLWLDENGITAFRQELARDPDHCAWAAFFDQSVMPWMARDIIAEPEGYPDDTRVASIWRQTYIECQELLYAIRHLSIGGRITDDDKMTCRARDWLLAAASWSPTGTTSRAYTDEWAFRVTAALAWGYDWLFDILSADERDLVRGALLARTKEIADHIIHGAGIHLFPFDSHAVRAVSAVLIPASIALLDDVDEARDWLDYSIEFLFTVYSPWGDDQGGWAEGPHYWTTAMAYLIEAANLLKSYTGLNLFDRPFFQKTGDFPLYAKAPDTRRFSFGDDSTLGDLPSLKVGYNLRTFAGVTGNGTYQWYYDEIRRNDPGTELEFYNYGWWDLRFDELVHLSMWPVVDPVVPSGIDRLRFFEDTGWAAIQYRMDDPSKHIQFLMKSSPFGSISHSHGDQNAFTMSAFGEDLAVQSGYYVAFNSTMHQAWRRQTQSKNAILINGKGQYAGRDKARQIRSTGRILVAEERKDHIYIKGCATPAYQSMTPEVTAVEREVYFVRDSYFVIVDSVDATAPVDLDWRLHTNGPLHLGSNAFRYTGKQAGFYGQVIWSEAGRPAMSQTQGYDGVDPAELQGLPEGYVLNAHFPQATRHRIVTLLVPYPSDDPRRVFHFLDDQGYDCDIYFTDAEENAFKIVVKKLARTGI
ncbi:DUF4962 domain-containing protein [Shimia biformata]|uniref:DUF4962 domain-containing protein n=1 Tax=Shimia biformata TaxID=1294299 RepID=UPI00194FD0C0|nr:DUF4962 domain-containing protein [Shimia biformata]